MLVSWPGIYHTQKENVCWASRQRLSSVGELTDPPPSVSCRVKRPELLNYFHFLILNLYNIIFIAIGGFLFRSELIKLRSFFFSDDTDLFEHFKTEHKELSNTL